MLKHAPPPMHQRAMPAALAIEAAGRQGKFWEMHDRLFSDPGTRAPEDPRRHAAQLQLDLARFDVGGPDPERREPLERQARQGDAPEALGAPASFINGRFVRETQEESVFRRVIHQRARRARFDLTPGTRPAELYARTTGLDAERR